MSSTYEAAAQDLRAAAGAAGVRATGDLGLAERGIRAQIGTGLAVLALTEQLEELVQLLRERSAPLPMPVPRLDACAVCSVPFVTGDQLATMAGRTVHHRCHPREGR